MQKIVNAIAIASGAVSLAVLGLGGYVFIRKDAIIDNVKSKVMESVMPGGLGGALGGKSGGLGGALGGKGGGLGGLDIPKFGAPTPDASSSTPSAPTGPAIPSSPF